MSFLSKIKSLLGSNLKQSAGSDSKTADAVQEVIVSNAAKRSNPKTNTRGQIVKGGTGIGA